MMSRFLAALFLSAVITASCNAADLLGEGDRYSSQGEWDKAVDAYRKAIDAEPDSSLALTRMGGAMLAQQRYSDSVPYFQQAISKDGANHGAFIGLGISYLHMGRYDLSRAALQEARKTSPEKRLEDIDKMIAWIDSKSSQAGFSHN